MLAHKSEWIKQTITTEWPRLFNSELSNTQKDLVALLETIEYSKLFFLDEKSNLFVISADQINATWKSIQDLLTPHTAHPEAGQGEMPASLLGN